MKQLKQETLKKTLKFAVHFLSGAKSSMRKKLFLQRWTHNCGFAKFNHFASPSREFLREFRGKTVTLLKRVLYKTFFNGNQFQATEKGNLLAR